MAATRQTSGSAAPPTEPRTTFATAIRKQRHPGGATDGEHVRRPERLEGHAAGSTIVPEPPTARAPGVAAHPERTSLSSPASVHRVAMAIEVLRTGDRARLELSFAGGAALQLEATCRGIAVTLCASPAEARHAAAELPALVAALGRRGVRVARAEVRVPPERHPSGRRPR